MDSPTIDPYVVIEEKHAGYVRYRSLVDGARWVVRGTCNQCGLCVVGAAHEHYEWSGEPGTPYAVVDWRVADGRLDEPITPGFPFIGKGCTLTVEG